MNDFPVYVFESGPINEELMCKLLLDYAKEFYRDPKNQAAYQEWYEKKHDNQ